MLLSHVHVLTDSMYTYTIKDKILECINNLLNDEIKITEFKQEMVCLITEVNIQIGVELTNFPIAWSQFWT